MTLRKSFSGLRRAECSGRPSVVADGLFALEADVAGKKLIARPRSDVCIGREGMLDEPSWVCELKLRGNLMVSNVPDDSKAESNRSQGLEDQ